MKKIGDIKLYDLDELSESLGVSKATLRRYIKQKRLPAQKIGGRFFVSEPALDEFFKTPYKKPKKAK